MCILTTLIRRNNLKTGTVKWFDSTKAFGFIKPDEGDKDIFVHQTDLVDGTINENDKVEFETEDGPRGPKAIKVKVI
tara:strand:- start:44 stop:274 length:231 start_codon:yes stop_codon:yes gene_type:complete